MPVEKDLLKSIKIILSRSLVVCISMRRVHLRVVLMEMQLILKLVTDDSELTDENLIKMNGVGQSLLTKIKEVSTGTCSLYEKGLDYDPKKVFGRYSCCWS